MDPNTNPQPEEPAAPPEPTIPVSSPSPAPVSAPNPVSQPGGTPSPVPAEPVAKYKVFAAMGDASKAIRTNAAAFFAVLLMSVVLSVIITIGYTKLLENVLNDNVTGDAKDASFIVGLAVSALLFVIIYAVISMLLSTITSLAVNEGAEGHKSQIGALIHKALPLLVRVMLVSGLIGLIILAPILVGGLLLGILSVILSPVVAVLTVVLVIGAIVWAFIAAFRYALATYVAIFEPNVPVMKVPARSQKLMEGNGGVLFLFKFILIAIVGGIIITILASILTGSASNTATTGQSSPVSDVISSLYGAYMSAVLVMFYRNRKAIKG